MKRTVVLGTGRDHPERVVTNDDLAELFETSDEWIRQRTGIRQRYWRADDDDRGASDFAVGAARRALEMAGLEPDDIDLIVHGTLSPDHFFPGDGFFLQDKLGVPAGVPVLDIRAQCSGFVYALTLADLFVQAGRAQRALVVGAELQSTGLDKTDAGRDVAVLFGDGGGAVVVGPAAPGDEDRGILATCLHADGRHATMLWTDAPSSRDRQRMSYEQLDNRRHYPQMKGRSVFKHAVDKMPKAVREVLDQVDLTPSDIDLFIPHQANLRISKAVQRNLGLTDDQVYNNIDRYGNTTAASIPIALDECHRAGRIQPGDLVCLASFGSGFTWGALLIRW